MIKSRKTRAEAFEDLRADYSAAKSSRFKRRRNVPTMGSGADYHYRLESDFLRIMEYARDMERNDAIAGPLVNQAVQNIVQGGLSPDPKTGDPGLDQAIKDRWDDWASDARQCSVDGEMVYRDIEKLALRRMFVDGDIFSVLTDDGGIDQSGQPEGALQTMEGHRCRKPLRNRNKNCVHGVLMDEKRRRVEYWFTKEDIDPMSQVKQYSDIEPVAAFEQDPLSGEFYRTVLHLRNPHRFTQTRGVSAFAPVFDLLGMHEDLHFAKLVQQQVASCIAILRNRDKDWRPGSVDPYGKSWSETRTGMERLIEELAPGMELRGMAGETISGFSPNIPNAEFFQQMRGVLQLIGINLGIPLVLLMMDASDTNFSGWRGAMDAARLGFRDMQQHLIDHWETPVYLWKVRQWAARDAGMRAALKTQMARSEDGSGRVVRVPKLYLHEWHAPRWPYIQPLQDAQADELRQRKLLSSPRRIHLALGGDWNQTVKETVVDNTVAILEAAQAAKALTQKIGERVTWREVLFLTDADMLKAATAAAGMGGAGGVGDKSETRNPKSEGEDSKAGFLQKLVLSLANNSITAPIIANALTLGKAGGVVDLSGAPINPTYDEPLLPVQVPAGQAQVTGQVVKDPDGDVVGGAVVQPTMPGGAAVDTGTKPVAAAGDGKTNNGGAAGGTDSQADDEKPVASPAPPPEGGKTNAKEPA